MEYLGYLTDAGSPHRMPLGLEPSGSINGFVAVQSGPALVHRPAAFAGSKEAQVLGCDDLRDGEAVVDLGHLDVIGGHTRHLVSLGGRGFGSGQGGQLVGVVQRPATGLACSGDVYRLVGKVVGQLGGHQQHAGGAVGDGRAIVEPKRPGDPGIGCRIV